MSLWVPGKRTIIGSVVLSLLLLPISGIAKEENPFAEFQKKRPKVKVVYIGDRNADITLAAIGKIYKDTTDLLDKAATRAENAKVPLTLAAASEAGVSQAEINSIIDNLSPQEQAMLDTYLANEVNALEVTGSYLTSAYALRVGVKDINVKALIDNPLKIPAALKGVTRGGKQIAYTIKALKFMSQYRKQLKTAQQYRGR